MGLANHNKKRKAVKVITMDKEKESFTNEYQEVMEFICQMQEAAHMQLDTMISQKKELEYKSIVLFVKNIWRLLRK